VLGGLIEGDIVVSSANFLIDAESNMGSSMESMDEGATSTPDAAHAPAAVDHSGRQGM
jgi:Cu(I)/Ag(I) efflux system membrane fusion protein